MVDSIWDSLTTSMNQTSNQFWNLLSIFFAYLREPQDSWAKVCKKFWNFPKPIIIHFHTIVSKALRQHISVYQNEGECLMCWPFQILPSNIKYKWHLSRQYNCWSPRRSWNIACRRCSRHIFILDLASGFNELDKDNCKTRRETFKFWNLVRPMIDIWR